VSSSAGLAEDIAIRLGMSGAMISKNVTRDEARHAMDVWGAELIHQFQMGFHLEVQVPGASDIPRLLKNNEIDTAVITIAEFAAIAPFVDGKVMLNQSAPEGEVYYLLAHQDSNIKSLADLKGRKLSIYDHPKMVLARLWLEGALAGAMLPGIDSFFGAVATTPKPNLAVLSTFFKNTDACLVNRPTFLTMTEMNPQLGIKLKVVASSPKLIPSLLVFRKNCSPEARRELKKAIDALPKSAAGQQALALFEVSGLVGADVSVLKPTLDLISSQERAHGRAK
jgi:ABC-type phosphate/phosphonate transport system substrate-binding protein